jgi:hypothetical protein
LTSELCHDPESTEIIIIDIIDHHINNNCQARFFRSFSLFLILLGVFLFYTSYVLRLHPLHFLINLLYLLSKEILIITFVLFFLVLDLARCFSFLYFLCTWVAPLALFNKFALLIKRNFNNNFCYKNYSKAFFFCW